MDFSFVAQGSAPRGRATDQQGPPQQATPNAPSTRPLFQIPSHREVHAAGGQASSAPNLFQPSGLASRGLQQQQQQQVHPQPPAAAAHALPHARSAPSGFGTPPLLPTPAQPPTVAGAAHAHGSSGYGVPSNAPSAPQHGPSHVVRPQAASALNPNAIIVSKRQQGNPLLRHIRNVRWQFGDVTADYVLGQNNCALFISLRYHLLHPEYILHRIKEQLRAWALIVVLCHIDVEDAVKPLSEVSKAAVLNGCTLVCGWTPEECARYLETFKSYETKPASGIQERIEPDYLSRLTAALTSIRGLNRTDAQVLGTARGTLADILRSTPEQLSACPGIGPTKARRLLEAFQQPFRKEVSAQTRPAPAAPSPFLTPANGTGHGTAAPPSTSAAQAAQATAAPGPGPGQRQAGQEAGSGAAVGTSASSGELGGSSRHPLGRQAEDMAMSEPGEPQAGPSGEGTAIAYTASATAERAGLQGDGEALEDEDWQEEQDELLVQATQMLAQVQEMCSGDEEDEFQGAG